MCTALIYRKPELDYCFLGFNRDESVKRKRSLLPYIEKIGNIEVLCPRDGDYGGTWIGSNSNGKIYAILNYYEATLKLIRNPISRGLLLRSLLFEEFTLKELYDINLAKYYPFRILCITPYKTDIFEWDGLNTRSIELTSTWQVLGSSFTMGPKAEIERSKLFGNVFLPKINSIKDIEEIASLFLTSHLPEMGALSPCMHRRDARTVSQTLIRFFEKSISMKYKNFPPCESLEFDLFSMPIYGR